MSNSTVAQYLMVMGLDEVTMLCESHAQNLEILLREQQREFDIYSMDTEQYPAECQACELARSTPNPTLQ
jgi:hypothetical protein